MRTTSRDDMPTMTVAELWTLAVDLTEKQMAEAVPKLPKEIRRRLKSGPLPRRWACMVCEAFGGRAYWDSIKPDLSDPKYVVFAYHEVPKLAMTTANDQWYGELANDSYRRCIEIYQAAGWRGKAVTANA